MLVTSIIINNEGKYYRVNEYYKSTVPKMHLEKVWMILIRFSGREVCKLLSEFYLNIKWRMRRSNKQHLLFSFRLSKYNARFVYAYFLDCLISCLLCSSICFNNFFCIYLFFNISLKLLKTFFYLYKHARFRGPKSL